MLGHKGQANAVVEPPFQQLFGESVQRRVVAAAAADAHDVRVNAVEARGASATAGRPSQERERLTLRGRSAPLLVS